MKKLVLLCFLIAEVINVHAQTLFTYGNHSVSKTEFLKAFNKNKTAADNKNEDLKQYLQLYILFKLKVQDAKDHRLDTLPALQADKQNFRNQVAANYLFDKDQLQKLTEEATKRSKKDIHLTGYFLKGTDSVLLKTSANKIVAELKKGKNIESLQVKGIDISPEDFGFITVFSLPYDIENIIYGLAPGQYSNPYKVSNGYYIFKNEEERPAMGKIKVAQILIAAPENDEAGFKTAALLADSLYGALQKGADFATLAKEFSNDRTTFMNGGEMPEMAVGKYSPAFESQAFALKNDGDISKPFKTKFGYHILKRISADPIPQVSNEDYAYNIKQELIQDPRIETARRKLIETATTKTGFSKKQVSINDIYKVTDTSLVGNKNITSGNVNENTVLYSFNDGTNVKVKDWILFLRNSGKVIGGQLHESYKKLMPDFQDQMILDNYKKRLEDFDADFAWQMKEFEEGNMLFEIMQRKIWTKAANDSAGLADYYEQNKEKYKWNKSADAIVFACSNEQVAKECINELNQNKDWRTVLLDHASQVQADSGRFELDQLPLNGAAPQKGISQPTVNRFDGTATFVDILKEYPKEMQRSFADARGLVINDYQSVLEQKWMDQLRKKYPVTINEKVFKSLLQ